MARPVVPYTLKRLGWAALCQISSLASRERSHVLLTTSARGNFRLPVVQPWTPRPSSRPSWRSAKLPEPLTRKWFPGRPTERSSSGTPVPTATISLRPSSSRLHSLLRKNSGCSMFMHGMHPRACSSTLCRMNIRIKSEYFSSSSFWIFSGRAFWKPWVQVPDMRPGSCRSCATTRRLFSLLPVPLWVLRCPQEREADTYR